MHKSAAPRVYMIQRRAFQAPPPWYGPQNSSSSLQQPAAVCSSPAAACSSPAAAAACSLQPAAACCSSRLENN